MERTVLTHEERGFLSLSATYGLTDAEIAAMFGYSAPTIARRRRAALEGCCGMVRVLNPGTDSTVAMVEGKAAYQECLREWMRAEWAGQPDPEGGWRRRRRAARKD